MMRLGPRSALVTALLILSMDAGAAAKSKRASRKPRELGREDSRRIVRLLGVRPGESVATIGAGSSFLLGELSSAVGPAGKVFVVDWDRTAIQGVQRRIEHERLSNVTAILGNAHDTLLPQPAAKVVMVNSYRLIDDRRGFFSTNRKYMTDDVRLAVIDFYRRPMSIGPPVRERVASHRVMRELRKFGYVLVDRHNISPYQYFLVYRPKRT